MIVALTLGLVLVAIPLYLWRRPRAESIGPSGSAEAGAAIASPVSAPSAEVVDAKPILGDPRNVMCQSPGGKKTPADQCDHLPEVERALASAITEAARCMPKEVGGGTVTYVADVSFKRKTIHVGTPKEGRSVKNPKVVAACQAAVRARLQTLAFDPIVHAHARYKIAITATYAGGT